MLTAPISRISLFLLGTVAWVGMGAYAQNTSSDLRVRLLALLPDNNQSAQVMDLVKDPEIKALDVRLEQAKVQDRRWFNEYVRDHSDETELPWHWKLGMSQSEWARYNDDPGIRFVKASPPRTARVTSQRSGNRVVFTGGSGAEELRGLSLDLDSGELRTAEGFAAKPYVIDISIKNGRDKNGFVDVFGQSRRGLGWRIDGESAVFRVIAKLQLFQLENGNIVLSYGREATRNNKLLPSVNIMLMFDKTPTSSKR